MAKGGVFSLIGESGSGKSTIIQTLLGFHPYSGKVYFRGTALTGSGAQKHQALRRRAQLVFQDPWASLSPYHSLQWSAEEPLRCQGKPKHIRKELLRPILDRLGISQAVMQRRPSEVSGGECQRACLARALVNRPEVLFLDEPLSALDAHIRKQVAELLIGLRREYNLTYFLVSHDLALVKKMASFVLVLYLGRVMEMARADLFFTRHKHPYSRALLSSVLTPGFWRQERVVLSNEMPSPLAPPKGCVFHTRCPSRIALCETEPPELRQISPQHFTACHLA